MNFGELITLLPCFRAFQAVPPATLTTMNAVVYFVEKHTSIPSGMKLFKLDSFALHLI